MRKLIDIVIGVFTFVTVLNVPIYAKYIDIEDSSFKEDIIQLERLEIIKGYPDGSFRPDNNISKIEFVSMIANITGMKTNDNTQSLYIDIPETHWAIGAINHCSDYGFFRSFEQENYIHFVTLDEEGNEIEVSNLEYIPEIASALRKKRSKDSITKLFNPDDSISAKDALKLVVYILGYNDYAEFIGYEKTCGDLGFLKYINFSEDIFLKRGEAANLINEALHVPIIEKKAVDIQDEEHTEFIVCDGVSSMKYVSLYTKYFE